MSLVRGPRRDTVSSMFSNARWVTLFFYAVRRSAGEVEILWGVGFTVRLLDWVCRSRFLLRWGGCRYLSLSWFNSWIFFFIVNGPFFLACRVLWLGLDYD